MREFSRCGPCITLGTITEETDKAWTITDRGWPGDTVRKLKSSRAAKSGLIHDEPCRSCRDHPESQYPNGYED